MTDAPVVDPLEFSQRWHVRTYEVDENGHTTDGVLLADIASEWVWVRLLDGRPARVPDELVAAFSPGAG